MNDELVYLGFIISHQGLKTDPKKVKAILEWLNLYNMILHIEFIDDHPSIDVAFQVIKTNIFEDIPIAMTNFNQRSTTIQH